MITPLVMDLKYLPYANANGYALTQGGILCESAPEETGWLFLPYLHFTVCWLMVLLFPRFTVPKLEYAGQKLL